MVVSLKGSGVSGRLPRGPHKLSPEQVAADQRRRLIDAMVFFAGTQGFAATPVTQLIERAGISRKTFYALFANREELLKAAFQSCAESMLAEELDEARKTDGNHSTRLEILIRRLYEHARAYPGSIALTTIEIAALNHEGLQLRARLMDDYARLIGECLGQDGSRATPNRIATAIAGALHREIHAGLRAGPDEFSDLPGQLARWARAYAPLPAEVTASVEPAKPWVWLGSNGLIGGRAPGTLSLAPAGYLRL